MRREESRTIGGGEKRRTGHHTVRIRRLLVLACLVSCAASTATASDLCGATILDDLRLDHDLICPGDGLIVGADGIRIDLNGHAIAGSGIGVGILVTGRTDVSIAGGTVRNFAVAVRLNAATDIVIKYNEFVDNAEAIDLQAGSVGNTVKANAFRNCTIRAIMLRSSSSENDIRNNTFTGNRLGILVFGGTDNIVKDNVISGSSLAGIRFSVIATGNVLKENRISSNAAGVEFVVTPTGSAVGNELKGNTIATNTCGLKGPTDGNTFKDNLFEGNVANTCF